MVLPGSAGASLSYLHCTYGEGTKWSPPVCYWVHTLSQAQLEAILRPLQPKCVCFWTGGKLEGPYRHEECMRTQTGPHSDWDSNQEPSGYEAIVLLEFPSTRIPAHLQHRWYYYSGHIVIFERYHSSRYAVICHSCEHSNPVLHIFYIICLTVGNVKSAAFIHPFLLFLSHAPLFSPVLFFSLVTTRCCYSSFPTGIIKAA